MRLRWDKAIGCKAQSRTDQPARSRVWPIRWTLSPLGCEPCHLVALRIDHADVSTDATDDLSSILQRDVGERPASVEIRLQRAEETEIGVPGPAGGRRNPVFPQAFRSARPHDDVHGAVGVPETCPIPPRAVPARRRG